MRAHKTTALVDADAQGSAQCGDVLKADAQLAPERTQQIVERGLGGFVVITHGQMVLQVGAHLVLCQQHRHAQALQQGSRPDTRELQQLRALDRTRTQHHRPARACGKCSATDPVGHACGGAAFEQHFVGHGAGLEPHRAAAQSRPQKRVGGGPAHAMARVDAVTTHAFGLRAVEVFGKGQAGLLRGGKEMALHRMQLLAHVAHEQRAARSSHAMGIDAALKAFVHRPHVVPRPAGIAQTRPVVEVAGQAAAIDHGVDGTGTTDHLAARKINAPVLEFRVRLGFELPVDALVVEGLAVTDGQIDPQAPVVATGFQQQYRGPAIGAQPVRQHAAG